MDHAITLGKNSAVCHIEEATSPHESNNEGNSRFSHFDVCTSEPSKHLPSKHLIVDSNSVTSTVKTNSTEITDDFSVNKAHQIKLSNVNDIDSDLGKIIHKLWNFNGASEENRNQIDQLKANLENIIKLTTNHPRLDKDDAAQFLQSILQNIKLCLSTIYNCLQCGTLPESNKDYLYHLAYLQPDLYFSELPYSAFSFMIFNLKDESHSNKLCKEADQKTKYLIDCLIRSSYSNTKINEDKAEKSIMSLLARLEKFKKDSSIDNNATRFTLGASLNIYGFFNHLTIRIELLKQNFNLSEEDIINSIIPTFIKSHTGQGISLCMSLKNLLSAIDNNCTIYSSDQNLQYLQVERWAANTIEYGIANNAVNISGETSEYIINIVKELEALFHMLKNTKIGFISKSSRFLKDISVTGSTNLNDIQNSDPLHVIMSNLTLPLKKLIVDGIFESFEEIFNDPQNDTDVLNHATYMKSEFITWIGKNHDQISIENINDHSAVVRRITARLIYFIYRGRKRVHALIE
ncbi:MAG: hypothetical protein ACPGEF_00925, partial [Endozoicomonas sp.]